MAVTSTRESMFVAYGGTSNAIRYIGEHYAESITHHDRADAYSLSIRVFERQLSRELTQEAQTESIHIQTVRKKLTKFLHRQTGALECHRGAGTSCHE